MTDRFLFIVGIIIRATTAVVADAADEAPVHDGRRKRHVMGRKIHEQSLVVDVGRRSSAQIDVLSLGWRHNI